MISLAEGYQISLILWSIAGVICLSLTAIYTNRKLGISAWFESEIIEGPRIARENRNKS